MKVLSGVLIIGIICLLKLINFNSFQFVIITVNQIW